jgi:hypothetical protein
VRRQRRCTWAGPLGVGELESWRLEAGAVEPVRPLALAFAGESPDAGCWPTVSARRLGFTRCSVAVGRLCSTTERLASERSRSERLVLLDGLICVGLWAKLIQIFWGPISIGIHGNTGPYPWRRQWPPPPLRDKHNKIFCQIKFIRISSCITDVNNPHFT